MPLDTSAADGAIDGHWAESDLSDSQVPVLIPIYQGTQAYTSLDWAGLSDVGWNVNRLAPTTPSPGDTPAGGGSTSSSAPAIVGEGILTAGKGRRKHVGGFELVFSEPLDPTRAANSVNYQMTQTIKHGRKMVNQRVKFSVRYTHGSDVVDLVIAGTPAFTKGGRIVVIATPPGGIADTSGSPLAGNTTLVILPKARGLVG